MAPVYPAPPQCTAPLVPQDPAASADLPGPVETGGEGDGDPPSWDLGSPGTSSLLAAWPAKPPGRAVAVQAAPDRSRPSFGGNSMALEARLRRDEPGLGEAFGAGLGFACGMGIALLTLLVPLASVVLDRRDPASTPTRLPTLPASSVRHGPPPVAGITRSGRG